MENLECQKKFELNTVGLQLPGVNVSHVRVDLGCNVSSGCLMNSRNLSEVQFFPL